MVSTPYEPLIFLHPGKGAPSVSPSKPVHGDSRGTGSPGIHFATIMRERHRPTPPFADTGELYLRCFNRARIVWIRCDEGSTASALSKVLIAWGMSFSFMYRFPRST